MNRLKEFLLGAIVGAIVVLVAWFILALIGRVLERLS